jgi:Uma2 family endonuclease
MGQTMPATKAMTAAEFLARPITQDSGFESLVEGEVVVTNPNLMHGALQARILVALTSWIAQGAQRGSVHLPADVQLDEHNVYKPDILWYSQPRKPDLRSPRPYPMPDIGAEVRSPSTWRFDIGAKKRGYERHELLELWLVDTEAAEILVFRRSRAGAAEFDVALELAAGDYLTSPQLGGFSLNLEELFRG